MSTPGVHCRTVRATHGDSMRGIPWQEDSVEDACEHPGEAAHLACKSVPIDGLDEEHAPSGSLGVAQTKAIQVQMARCSGPWWPIVGKDWTFARRCSEWACNAWKLAGIPSWDAAIAARWWRRAGRVARLGEREPPCWCCRVGRATRLHRGHRFLGRRRRDDPIPATVATQAKLSWQDSALDHDAWRGLAQALVARVMPRQEAKTAGGAPWQTHDARLASPRSPSAPEVEKQCEVAGVCVWNFLSSCAQVFLSNTS